MSTELSKTNCICIGFALACICLSGLVYAQDLGVKAYQEIELNTTEQQLWDSLTKQRTLLPADTAQVNFLTLQYPYYQSRVPGLAHYMASYAYAMALRINYPLGQANALNRLGNLNEVQGNYSQAMNYYLQSMRICEALQLPKAIAVRLNNMSIVHMYLGYYDRAKASSRKAMQLALHSQDKVAYAWYTNTLGMVFREAHQLDSALHYIRFALVLRRQYADTNAVINSYYHLGITHLAAGNIIAALPYLQTNYSYSRSQKNQRSIAQALGAIGEGYYKLGQYVRALHYLDSAQVIAEALGYKEILRPALHYQALAYAQLGNYDKAFAQYRQYHIINDSLINLSTTRRVADLEYQQALQNSAIEVARQSERALQSQRLTLTFGIALIAVCLLGAVLWRTNQQRKHANSSLQHTLHQLRSTQQELILAEKMATLGRIVANVSHELNTPLGAIKSSATSMQQSLSASPPDALTPAQQQLVQQLLAASHWQHDLSTRALRQLRLQLVASLAQHGIQPADDWAEKLLAAGIHDIQGLLPALQSEAVHAALVHVQRIYALRRNLLNILQAVAKTSKVIHTLRTFGKHSAAQQGAATVALAQHIQDALAVYASYWQQGIGLQLALLPHVMVHIQPEAMAEVWRGIVYNAIQAMQGHGQLAIAMQATEKTVQVQFADNGPGIPTDLQPQVFQPFFSTKASGEGSGLSLFVSQRILEQQGGSISFSSQPGNTTFTVTLPLAT